ncbi:RCC1/BLIP-II protein [Xylona heveae TC161]|uniref:RCC1/BLIP-II protein n=1 Tax=Xylona heveae (strain CBS 132557 / TC161) TaxID=1328760 RepID=A0A165GY17_XYLHT|nr:RCC1/BLIP-II protein [Xylona heveae TC161]KZF22747.1 RCC1/BLIP-II protein [Xylona heveae TC161]
MLYAFGSNGSGQLGLGHTEDVSIPSLTTLPAGEESQAPLRIVAGGNHTLVLFPSGAIYAAGENDNGRCGPVNDAESSQSTFRRVSFTDRNGMPIDSFKLCSATWAASTFVTADNQVFSCGSGQKGELGLGPEVKDARVPQVIANFPPPETEIVDLSACMGHTIALLSDGTVYGWGASRKGQLGVVEPALWGPSRISGIDFSVIRAACGREFSFFKGSQGQHVVLGSDKWNIISNAPASSSEWKDVGAGWGNIVQLSSDGGLSSWGRNDHGQLAPRALPKIEQIAIGSEHTLALTTMGKLLAWGWGEHGNCGPNGDGENKSWNEIRVDDNSSLSISSIGAGCASSFLWAVEEGHASQRPPT